MTDLNYLPAMVRTAALKLGDRLCEIRLRSGKSTQLITLSGEEILTDKVSVFDFRKTVSDIMGHSLYACEDELSEGYIILKDGSRAGVCGSFTGKTHSIREIGDISGLCIRIAHEIKGCGDRAVSLLPARGGMLIVSPPGLGKTTILRDIVRQISDAGRKVCLVDERGELAAGANGRLDVGERTDVYAFLPKHTAVLRAVRTMAPDVVAVDELGGDADAEALGEAYRCGVDIIATVHGFGLERNAMRGCAARLVDEGLFSVGVLLGPERGAIAMTTTFGLQ